MILKYKYNQIINKELEHSHEILNNLYINNFYKDRINTFIFMDDASLVL